MIILTYQKHSKYCKNTDLGSVDANPPGGGLAELGAV